MVIATFGPGTGWTGKTILYQAGQFVLEDHGKISAKAVLHYDAQGYLEWPYDGLREWVTEIAASKSTASSRKASSKTSPGSTAAEPRTTRVRAARKNDEYEVANLATSCVRMKTLTFVPRLPSSLEASRVRRQSPRSRKA